MAFRGTLILSLILSCQMSVAQMETDDDSPNRKLPVRVGDLEVVKANTTQQTGPVLTTDGTAYLVTRLSNGTTTKLQISHTGAVKRMIQYKGWPFILDKNGRLYAADVSWHAMWKHKIPYLFSRLKATGPIGLIIGGTLWGFALFDQTFTGFITSGNLQPGDAFLGGLLATIGVDSAHTLFLKSPSQIGKGTNLFTEEVAKKVVDITYDKYLKDFRIDIQKTRKEIKSVYLSQLVPSYVGTSECIERLTKMNMK